jgi:hypothetical protein
VSTLDAVNAPLLGVALVGTPAPRWRRRPVAAYPELDPVPSQQRTPAPVASPKPPTLPMQPARPMETPAAPPAPTIGTPGKGLPTNGAPTNGQDPASTEQVANGVGGRPSPTPRR